MTPPYQHELPLPITQRVLVDGSPVAHVLAFSVTARWVDLLEFDPTGERPLRRADGTGWETVRWEDVTVRPIDPATGKAKDSS